MTWQYRPTPKFGNKKVEHAGRTFDSKLEVACYDFLKKLELAGEIQLVQAQKTVYLTRAKIGYRADFECVDMHTKLPFYVEAKGMETPEWKLKLRLWRYYGPAPLHIYMGTYKSFKLTEIVLPENSE